MLFSSAQYMVFLPVIVLLYWILPKSLRLPMLLIASYGFYMSFIPAFILLILPMTLFNFLWGNWLYKSQNKRLGLGIGITINLLVLAIFKYADFFYQSANFLALLTTKHNPSWVVNIILPLGISFFTFEFIHYLFEIYRGKQPIKSFVLFALFAAFFPTQIAGPIKRYPDFEAQMLSFPKLELKYFDEGIPLIIIGLAKKILLADNLATFVQMGLALPQAYGSLETWLFAYAFAFQIYFDFSGYTDIARGSSMLFGYHIPINFNLPYIANNMSNFWHRWHISLSTWLRDYLFIPLGGSRGGGAQINRNLFWTMTLGGLWHGASWNFVVWGIFHGLALIVHREFARLKESISWLKIAVDSKLGNFISTVITFHVVCIGWIFFRETNIATAFGMVKKMVLLKPIYSTVPGNQFLVLRPDLPLIVPVTLTIIAVLLITNFPLSWMNESGYIKRQPVIVKAVYCSILVLLMVTFLPDNSQPFIYFQF
jgi:alginate O-acetyltransferase complex protein AlgI